MWYNGNNRERVKAMLEREKHEDLLNELLDVELETSRKTEILQELRVDHVAKGESITEYDERTNKLEKDNYDLVASNSRLFRQSGIVGNEGKEKEVEEQEYSETVTLEELEGE